MYHVGDFFCGPVGTLANPVAYTSANVAPCLSTISKWVFSFGGFVADVIFCAAMRGRLLTLFVDVLTRALIVILLQPHWSSNSPKFHHHSLLHYQDYLQAVVLHRTVALLWLEFSDLALGFSVSTEKINLIFL